MAEGSKRRSGGSSFTKPHVPASREKGTRESSLQARVNKTGQGGRGAGSTGVSGSDASGNGGNASAVTDRGAPSIPRSGLRMQGEYKDYDYTGI